MGIDTVQSQLAPIFKRFKNASDSMSVQRRIVAHLAGFMAFDESLLMRKAGPGKYNVTITLGEQRKTQRLIIREDPLLSKE